MANGIMPWQRGGPMSALAATMPSGGAVVDYDPATGTVDVTSEERQLAKSCGCSVAQLRGIAAASLRYIRGALKSGNINQGYAQCDVDELALMVANGQCSAERITCRNEIGLRATAVAAGGVVTHTITPVGPAFLREILTVIEVSDDPMALGAEFWVTQITGAGRFAQTGTVTSTGAGQPAAGWPIGGHSRAFQNYVASSGIIFNSAQALQVTVQNIGTAAGSYTLDVTYDVIRAG